MTDILDRLEEAHFVLNPHPVESAVLSDVEDYIRNQREETERIIWALENLIIAIGMGWDLEGVIEVAETTIEKMRETNR